ncbi:MAG: peptidoglycan-associated lipoprotein Pal [Syntrophales bacterium LBB04]|nr:peptidoglycan-associated lipoprotein Pal [Syntrophales bacterium LBB04]
MKKNHSLFISLIFLSVVFAYGCAGTGKTVLQEEQERAAAAKEAAAVSEARTPAAEGSTVTEDEAAKKRAEKEQVERDAILKAQAAAEREAAAKAKAQAEKEASDRAAEAAKKAAASAKALYEFDDVRFDFDKFNLRDEARAILNKHGEWLGKNSDVMILVEGHCDERGTAEYNLALGERRANAVAKYLTDMGIDAKRIKTVSYGEEKPLDPGHNEEAWAKNRRAHFVVSGKK